MKEDKLIVGVLGTQCVGKSTFINDVVMNSANRDDKSMRWTMYGANYREEIEKRGLKINRDGNEECQKVIHSVLLGNIQKAVDENDCKRIIMDRTIIDSFAYTFWHFAFGNHQINPKTLEVMWNQVCRYAKMFNCLVYIPLDRCDDVMIVDDRFRDTNPEYRKQIDKIIHCIVASLALEGCTTTMIYGTRESRMKQFYILENNMEHDLMNGKFTGIRDFSARVLLP